MCEIDNKGKRFYSSVCLEYKENICSFTRCDCWVRIYENLMLSAFKGGSRRRPSLSQLKSGHMGFNNYNEVSSATFHMRVPLEISTSRSGKKKNRTKTLISHEKMWAECTNTWSFVRTPRRVLSGSITCNNHANGLCMVHIGVLFLCERWHFRRSARYAGEAYCWKAHEAKLCSVRRWRYEFWHALLFFANPVPCLASLLAEVCCLSF